MIVNLLYNTFLPSTDQRQAGLAKQPNMPVQDPGVRVVAVAAAPPPRGRPPQARRHQRQWDHDFLL